MDSKPNPQQGEFSPKIQQQQQQQQQQQHRRQQQEHDSITSYLRPVTQDRPSLNHHNHNYPHHSQQHYPSPTSVDKDPSSLPPTSSPFHISFRHKSQLLWPSHTQHQQSYPTSSYYHQEPVQNQQWQHEREQTQQQQDQHHLNPLTQQCHDIQIEKNDSDSNNDNSNNHSSDINPPPLHLLNHRSASSLSNSAIDPESPTRQYGPSSGRYLAESDPVGVNSYGNRSSLSSRSKILDQNLSAEGVTQEKDQCPYPPSHSPNPHRSTYPRFHPTHFPLPSPYSSAAFISSQRDRDRNLDRGHERNFDTVRELTRPMSNLTYQHRQYQLRQQKQIQQQELSRRQIQGQSPPRSSPDESLDDSRSARFSISSNDGNRYPVRSLVHPIPPHLHYRHREGSLSPPISSSSTKAVATAAVPASTENLDLEVSADRPLISSHGLPAATSKSTSSTGTISMAATKAHTPLDDLPSSSTSLPFSGRDREYDLDARTSLYPLDNPRNAYAYLRPHYYHNAYRRHSAQSSQSHPYPIDPYYPYRSHNLARSGSFDEGDPEYHYPRSYWDSQYGDPLPSYYPPRYSAYYPPYFDTPLPRLGPVTAPLLSEPSHHLEDINSYHAVLSRGEGRTPSRPSSNEDGEERRQSKERGEQAHEESQATSSSRFHNLRFKFGTEMPSTIDLKSAIESCDILCRFALHYENQMSNSNSTSQSTVEGSMLGLNQDERANLQRIRNMNTTMLIGIQKAEKMNNPSLASSTSADHTSESLEAGRAMEEDVTGNNIEEDFPEFGQGQPWNIMVLELARAATSIFQLAIRIKAWVNMTPEERELDEEINMIRGKRCLLMDSTLAIPIVDQHGNLQKDWAIVPAAASTSKTFYQRQRDLEQQRQSQAVGLSKQLKNGLQVHQIGSTAAKHELGMSVDSNGTMIDHEGPGESTFKIPRRNSGTGGVSSTAASRHDLSKLGVEGRSDIQMSSSLTSNISSIGTSGKGGRIYRPSDPVTRNSKYSDVPHQKYRKRAKRSQAPGRCRSCNSSDTPEWRRGPDGARTLCNACGLHYAKLLKRQNEQGQQSASRIAFVPHSANSATSTSTTTIAAHAATITTTPAPTSPVATTTTAIASSSSEVVTTTLQPLSAPITAPAPVPAPAPTLAATATTEVTVNKDKTVNQSSSGMNSTFPLISFPFKRQHGFGKTKTSLSSSTSTATPTTATSTATVTTTTSLTFSKSSEGRTMTDHQVVPMYDGQNPVSNDLSAIRKSTHHNGRRNGPVSNTSQYQMLQRQQLQCQQMEFQKPNTNDQDNMQDVTMNHS